MSARKSHAELALPVRLIREIKCQMFRARAVSTVSREVSHVMVAVLRIEASQKRTAKPAPSQPAAAQALPAFHQPEVAEHRCE